MYKDFTGKKVTIVVSSRGDNLLEYVRTLQKENDNCILMSDVNISYLMLNFQKGFFGNNINQYKENLSQVLINKKYIISCNKD